MPKEFYDGLRRPAGIETSPNHELDMALPVLFFGDIFKAKVATVGLNPSWQEHLDPSFQELNGASRRFETLTSLNAKSRAELTNAQCDRAMETMRRYFDQGKPVYPWFVPLMARVESVFDDVRYVKGGAVHLDLVQEATIPVWSALEAKQKQTLLQSDLPFLEWELKSFDFSAVVCNGKTAFDAVSRSLGSTAVGDGAIGRVKWYVGRATLNQRSVWLIGWNLPLPRWRLDSSAEAKLVRSIRAYMGNNAANP